MLGPMDEYPVHQLPQPIAWPGSSDRNFYDRSYFNAHAHFHTDALAGQRPLRGSIALAL